MTTGYTEILERKPDTTFEAWAMRCARAFGPLMDMRDAPLDAEIPEEIQPDLAHDKNELVKAEALLKKLKAMTLPEAEREAEAEHQRLLRADREYQKERTARRAIYQLMLDRVNVWVPPTPGHAGLQAFMREQLEGAMEWGTSPSLFGFLPERKRGKVWRAEQIDNAQRDIDYHQERILKATKHAQEATDWLRALRASLVPPEAE